MTWYESKDVPSSCSLKGPLEKTHGLLSGNKEGKGARRSSEKRLQFMCGGVECSSPGPGHVLILSPASGGSALFRLVHCITGRGGKDNIFTFLSQDD